MLQNYLKIAWRNLLKHKLFTFIKLFGLTAGITAAILIAIYVQHEFSYDGFHEQAEDIVHVSMEYKFDGEVGYSENTGNKVSLAFKTDFPEVKDATKVIKYSMPVKYEDKLYEEKNIYYADSSFFEIFTFPLIHVSAKEALLRPNQVVLTASTAKKYFNDSNPLGKNIRLGSTKEYVVSGVMEDPPINSQMKPDFVASFSSLRDAAPERLTFWSANYATYLLLHKDVDVEKMQAKIFPYMEGHAEETRMEPGGDNYLTYNLTPLKQVHLRSTVPGNFEPNADIRYVYILIAIGFLILFIGGITYVNLTTVSSSERASDIAVQKVLGAGQKQIFGQHISESLLLTFSAILIALGLSKLFMPMFNQLFERELDWSLMQEPSVILTLILSGVLLGLLAGFYPAVVVSNFQPSQVFRGESLGKISGKWLQKGMIVFQFGISVFLLICTVVLIEQLDFIRNTDLGYDESHVISLPADSDIIENLNTFKTVFKENNHVKNVSLVYESPVHIKGGYGISLKEDGEYASVTAIPVDNEFIQTMDIPLLAGQELNQNDIDLIRRIDQRVDSTSSVPILINEAQALKLGWTAEEAINKTVYFQKKSVIKGVVQNFHFSSLHEPIGNLVIFPSTWGQRLLVKLSSQQLPSTLAHLENKWGVLAPHRPFTYQFLSEEIEVMYKSEAHTVELVKLFSFIAILLACLGLFGIATFSIFKKTKEIGLRKILGASVFSIVGMLSKDFVKLVLIAILVFAPLAWYMMNQWLQNFSYRIEIQWWVILLAGFISIVVAVLTISVQSVRAALTNPVESLRNE